MFMMPLIFSGFASIPLWLTMKPSSFPDGMPKTHLVGFSFHLKLHKLLKVSSRSGIKESYSFCLYDHVIDVSFHIVVELIGEA